MQAIHFEEVLEKITAKDPRYHRDAYLFVREALDHTQKEICKKQEQQLRHVSGEELLDGIRDYALRQYGPMSLTLLHEWGVRRTDDFGEIVFNMVEAGLLNKTDSDSRADFKDGYNFEEAFLKPFRPSSPPATPRESKPAQSPEKH